MIYKIKNICKDMTIAGIKPGGYKKLKELTPKHIEYCNRGFLAIKQEEDKKQLIKEDKKDKIEQKDEVKE